jgi:hypothetical protein
MYNFEDKDFQKEYSEYMKKKRAAARKALEEQKATAQKIKDAMTVEEKIELMNTPFKMLPDELKPGMTQNPQMFNFVRMSKPHIGGQKETFAARLIKYMDKYSLTPERFSEICNEYASKYDLPATKNRRAQRTRITKRDINNYENYNVCPKIDKMTVIAAAMGVGIDYFAGYGADNRRSSNEVLEAKYRKSCKRDSRIAKYKKDPHKDDIA